MGEPSARVVLFLFEHELNELNEFMENPLKDCLTIQVSEVDVDSPDFGRR